MRSVAFFVCLALLTLGGMPISTAQEPDVDVPEADLGLADSAKVGSLPPQTEALAKKAASAFADGDFGTAREAYTEMLRIEPTNGLAWANLGAVEQQSGNRAEAVQAFEQAVRFNPSLAQAWIALGLAYSERGDSFLAVSALTRAIHEDPANARPHNYLAITMKRLGWSQAAQAELERAVELAPGYGIAHFNLALSYLDQRPPATELAERHYERALSLGVEKDEIVERKLAAVDEEVAETPEDSAAGDDEAGE